MYALCSAPAVSQEEKVQLNNQREAKHEKKQILRQKKMLACQKEYGNKLTYIKMANSPAFWKTKTIAKRKFKSLASQTARLNVVKEQIKI